MTILLRIASYAIGLPLLAFVLYAVVPARQYVETTIAGLFTYAVVTYLLNDLVYRHKNGDLR
ncbi:hypothetical protein [Acetobacter cibinongensis]|uniref:Uncharacterized protein n=1 Tax=Acetobacter cibinongensis TaxID=146475 RepID=A0A1Z5YXU7_9PROT|nr:hypothetical protein [Acetobacter cibinongensis]OUJ04172.1 hypothetical protein HK14_13835 [Acetobacter cibinongensis]